MRKLGKAKETYLILRMTPNNIFIAVHNLKGHVLS